LSIKSQRNTKKIAVTKVAATVTDKMNAMNINVASNGAHPLSYLHQVFIRPFPNIKLSPVSTKEVCEIIKSLKWKNSHDYDEISIKILKISSPFIISPLTYTVYATGCCLWAHILRD
jgi:hypothetical protein